MKNGVWAIASAGSKEHFIESGTISDHRNYRQALCGHMVWFAHRPNMHSPHCKRCEKKLKGGK